MNPRIQLLVYICLLIHFTYSTYDTVDVNKNPDFTTCDLEQNSHHQCKVEQNFYNNMCANENVVQNIFKNDNLDCNQTEKKQNRKRRRQHHQNCMIGLHLLLGIYCIVNPD
jgi:hypothetical protein